MIYVMHMLCIHYRDIDQRRLRSTLILKEVVWSPPERGREGINGQDRFEIRKIGRERIRVPRIVYGG
jgi:hypothetical protein